MWIVCLRYYIYRCFLCVFCVEEGMMARGAAAYGSRQVERALPPVGAGPAQHGKAAAWGCGLVVEAMQGRKGFAVEKGGTRGGKGNKKSRQKPAWGKGG